MNRRIMRRRGSARRAQQGSVLTMTFILAVIAAISAYVILLIVLAQNRQAGVQVRHVQAEYIAEAALAWANQQLAQNPAWTSTAGTIDLTIAGVPVDIIFPPCAAPPCPTRQMQAKVAF